MLLLDILTKSGVVSEDVVANIYGESNGEDIANGVSIVEKLVEKGVSDVDIAKAVAEYYSLPVTEINTEELTKNNIIDLIPEETVKLYSIAPIRYLDDKTVEIGMVDPGDMDTRNMLDFIFYEKGLQYSVSVMPLSVYKKILSVYSELYGLHVGAQAGGNKGSGKKNTDVYYTDEVMELEDLIKSTELKATDDNVDEDEIKNSVSAPVVKMVASMLFKAINSGASDVHIEIAEKQSRVRYRIDGLLKTVLVYPKDMHGSVVARIKILARLKLDEKRRPQDGRFPARVYGRTIDFRVSVMPTFYGEKVVVRILDPGKGILKLEDTGMSPYHIDMMNRALDKPYGIILITGPTGSGKSTTLQALLHAVDREKNNVISLEDPIEYKIEGVSQSQVRPEIGYTFASGLRSILRQDPDMIMVGEIRDSETAKLAIQAALTGHMVFSTLHTNNAIGVVPRLIDMGVEPYLLAPTLILSVAQRLVRKIIPGREVEVKRTEAINKMVEKSFEDLPEAYKKAIDLNRPLYDTEVDPEKGDGTKGRIAVFEMIETTPELEKMIMTSPDEQEIYKLARRQGFLTMQNDAYLKCMAKKIRLRDVNSL